MNKQDMLKVQTCFLKVNIHCDGCKEKVKKKLQKIQGVYKVSIDVEQGKVMVSGNVDPEILVKKLEKAGKHAELWGAPKGPISFNNNQFMNFRNENVNGGKDNKSQKGGKDQHKGGHQAPLQIQQNKGSKDLKFLGKSQKSVKFNVSEDEEDDEFDDDFDDEFDDEFDNEFGGRQPPNKVANGGGGGGRGPPPKANVTPNGHQKGAANNNGGTGKKGGGGFDAFLKGMMGKRGGKKANGGKNSSTEPGNQIPGNGKKGGKNGGFVLGEGKNGAKNGGFILGEGKDVAKHGGKGARNNDNWSKKGGDKFDGVPKFDNKQKEFPEMNGNHGKNMGNHPTGQMGNYPTGQMGNYPTGQMGNFPVPQGYPPAAAMNLGHFPAGLGQGNPYSQQQQHYLAQMMMNQQRGNGHDMYHPMMFNRIPPPAMNYGPPPPATDRFTHIFSDENTDSCSIM